MSTSRSTGKRRWKIGAAVLVGSLIVGGGAAVLTAPSWASETAFSSEPTLRPALSEPIPKEIRFTATPAEGAVGVNPGETPVVKAENADITSVQLRPEGSEESVEGNLSEDKRTWTAAQRLQFNTAYTFAITLTDSTGHEVKEQRTFHTVKPANEADARIYPLDGADMGIGQPIEINFSEPVLNKDAVEAAINVTSTSGQDGAFYWISDTKARYRPKEFWKPNSSITVEMNLFGVDFGNGMIGNADITSGFTTHNKRVAVVDNVTKTMKVFIDGKHVRSFPVTLGTKEWPSLEGYQVVMEQYARTQFRAETIGLDKDDDFYYKPVMVNHASRLTNGGVFVHEALPAAQPVLGKQNVSHGCIGMSPEGAKYFYDTFGPGDLVKVENTNHGPMFVWDGYGGWNMTWEQWTSNYIQKLTE